MVVEELLTGPEISVLAISDGYSIIPLPAAQDHKRIGEGDTGLNTGGMGAYSPAPVATPDILERIMNESLKPTIDGMRREGTVRPYLRSPLFLIGLARLSLRRSPLRGLHAHRVWPQGVGIQCPFR